MRKLIACLFAIVLGACAHIQNPVNETRLATVESAYGVALSIAVGYRNTRLCKRGEQVSITNICARRDVILQLQAADRNAQLALKEARTFVKDNPTLDAIQVIQAAESAISVFRQIEANYGVQ